MTAATEAALYRAWQASGTSDKVLLSLFETAIVESGARNLASRAVPESLKFPHEGVAAGDHDSVGVLQQRASWGSVGSRMNVTESAQRYLAKAKRVDRAGMSAGQLAQAVQVSAFPLKYDAVAGRARLMIARQKVAGGSTPAITPVANPVTSTVDFVAKLSNPRTWIRIGLFVAGLILMMIALAKMTGNNSISPMTKRVAAAVVTKRVA